MLILNEIKTMAKAETKSGFLRFENGYNIFVTMEALDKTCSPNSISHAIFDQNTSNVLTVEGRIQSTVSFFLVVKLP